MKGIQTDAQPDSLSRLKTRFGVALMLALGVSFYAYTAFKTVVVSGDSMLPTFTNGTRLLVSNAYWLIGPIRDKDIVVIQENNSTGYIIKRVNRLEGEVVDFYNVPRDWSLARGEYKVPQGQVFVLGDNREISEDSRRFGAVDSSRIIGKVVLRPGVRAH